MTVKIPISVALKAVKSAFRGAAPDILREAIIQMLNLTDIDKAKAWVKDDITLWEQLGKGVRLHILKAACMLLAKDISWLDYDWVVSAIRDEHPELASYFSNDDGASDWLKRQIDGIKWEIFKYPCPLEDKRKGRYRKGTR